MLNLTSPSVLGQAKQFPADPTARVTLLKAPNLGDPQVWTIATSQDWQDGGAAGARWNIVAEVEFGSGSSMHRVEFDWGGSISVPASSVMVTAKYDGIVGFPMVIPTDLYLQATIGAGSGNARAQRNYLAFGNTTRRIPPFATRFHLIPGNFGWTNTYDPLTIVNFAADPGFAQIVSRINGSDYIGSFADGFPIPKFARYIQLLGVAGGSVNLMFDIEV
jgi:hypothetical protein